MVIKIAIKAKGKLQKAKGKREDALRAKDYV